MADVITGRAARLDGGIALSALRTSRGSGVERLTERGGYRARATREGDVCEVFLLNPSGGLVGGDRIGFEVTAAAGAAVTISTAAAERVYRSDGPDTRVSCSLVAGAGSTLEWLPQQTVWYDGSRYRRRLTVDADPESRVTVLEAVALGRTASGEALTDVAIHDQWRIHRGGRLVLAEALRLVGDATARVRHPSIGAGATAVATLVHVTPDAQADLQRIRSCLDGALCCGASAVDGVVVARWLAPEPMRLVAALQAFLERFRGRPAPRGW
jgi:urease accessory protein